MGPRFAGYRHNSYLVTKHIVEFYSVEFVWIMLCMTRTAIAGASYPKQIIFSENSKFNVQ